jgi:hypothetical protein
MYADHRLFPVDTLNSYNARVELALPCLGDHLEQCRTVPTRSGVPDVYEAVTALQGLFFAGVYTGRRRAPSACLLPVSGDVMHIPGQRQLILLFTSLSLEAFNGVLTHRLRGKTGLYQGVQFENSRVLT